MIQNIRTYSRPLFILYVFCSLIAILYLPSLVPLPPSASYSYVFGYNNRVGVVLVLLLVAVGSVWTRGLNLQLRPTAVSQPVPLKTLVLSLVAILLACLAMYTLAGRFGGFGESTYGIDRAWLLSQGKVPYLDFEYAYGAAFLYVPLMLQHLLSIDLSQAYYLFWILNFLLGTLLLYAVVNLIDYPTNSKRAIFLLTFGAGFYSVLYMGTLYTYLRYTSPVFFVLVVNKLFDTGTKSRVYAPLVAVAFTGILLLISPETAIAHAFACTCIFLFTAPSRSRRIFTVTGFLLAVAPVFWAALKLHVFDTTKTSGSGSESFPITFAPYILLFFAALFVCACYIYLRFSKQGIHDNTFGLIAFSIPMIAASLGRCNPLHTFGNGEGIFLASMFYVSNYKTLWKGYKAFFIVSMILLPGLAYVWLNVPLIARVGLDSLGEGKSNSSVSRSITYFGHKYVDAYGTSSQKIKLEAMIADAHLAAPDRIDLSGLYPSWHGRFLAPFAYKPNGIGPYLSNQIDSGRYQGFVNANTAGAIQEKVAEIKNHPDQALLLPYRFERNCQIDISAERREISALSAFPFLGKAVHMENVRQPVCDFIFAHYSLEQEPTPQNFWFGLWVAKPVPSRL